FDIAYVLIVAFLMASRIPHFSGKRIGRVPREYVIAVLFGIAACLLLLAIFTMEMLIGLTLVYLATIPFAIRRFNAYAAEDAARQATAAGALPVAQARK
ncbi:MAG: CDP-diacylglycerol--serine O-phosphatidyltransferase, partial [Methylocella sp.]